MSSKEIFLGRQPILNRKQDLFAYELLFRSSATSNFANIDDIHAASLDVVLNALCDFGGVDVLGGQKGFLNIEAEFLLTDSIELLPKDRVVIELLETVEITPEVVERCKELKKNGFVFAIDDFTYELSLKQNYEPLFEIVDVIKIDVLEMSQSTLSDLVKSLKRWPAKLLAEKVEDNEQFQFCYDLGFQLFQGYYFSKPSILSRKRIDLSKVTLLALLEKVLGDSSTSEVEDTLKKNPELTYNLLRLVNSVGMDMSSKISTLRHAIVVLGREQLKRWVQLLLFTHGTTKPAKNPLMQMAAMRGKMMELLAKGDSSKSGDKEYEDLAFMVGILSLLDTLLGIPMEDVVEQISLQPSVKNALLHRDGDLGKLMKIIETLEVDDFASAESLVESASLKMDKVLAAQLDAITWTNKLVESL